MARLGGFWTHLNIEAIHMSKYDRIVRVGVDLAQSVVQVHAVDAAGSVVAAMAGDNYPGRLTTTILAG